MVGSCGTSATCVSSSQEGIFSNFEHIQSKRRNKLTPKRANAFVDIFSTMQLVRKCARDAAADEKAAPPIPWHWADDKGNDEVLLADDEEDTLDKTIEISDEYDDEYPCSDEEWS